MKYVSFDKENRMSETSSKTRNASIDTVQSGEYSFPYHYIPSPKAYLKLSKFWTYSASYIAALNLTKKWLISLLATNKTSQHRHMDYGCGDGGFLYALNQDDIFFSIDFDGIDIDERALKWGKLFSSEIPNINLMCESLHNLEADIYDSGTLIEVFEHIPIDEAPDFVNGISKSLKKNSMLFVTVPSTEIPVIDKHYRHFDFESIQRCFSDKFHIISCVGFEKSGVLSKVLKKLMMQKRIYIETSVTSKFFIREFERTFQKIKGCGRIALVLKKK